MCRMSSSNLRQAVVMILSSVSEKGWRLVASFSLLGIPNPSNGYTI